MRTLAKASTTLTTVSVTEIIWRFVRAKAIAIWMGPLGTGVAAQFIAFFEFLRLLGDMGARRVVIKEVAECVGKGKKSPEYREVLTTSFSLVFIVSTVSAVITAFLARPISISLYGSPDYYLYIIGFSFILPIASLSTVTASVLKGNFSHGAFVRYTLIAHGLLSVITPVLIYAWKYWGILLAQALFFAFPLVGYLCFHSKKPFLFFSKKINGGVLKEQFSYGFLEIYGDALVNLSRIILAALIIQIVGLHEMGIYQVVLTLSAFYLAIPMHAIGGYMLPLISSSKTEDEIRISANECCRFLLFALTPLIMILMIWPNFFIFLFYSHEFMSAATLLKIQLIGSWFQLASAAWTTTLQARAKLKAIFWTSSLRFVLFLGLSWLLAGRWELLGVTYAFVISNFVYALAQYGALKYFFKLKLLPKNRRLFVWTSLWLLIVFFLLRWNDGFIWRITATLFFIPWFWFSSKDHERQFLIDRLGRFKIKAHLWQHPLP